jgi:hypothetical protein
LKLSRASEKLTTRIALSSDMYNTIGWLAFPDSSWGSLRLPVPMGHGVPSVDGDDLSCRARNGTLV